uniref:MATH domain-containing protein n=1 Tax=Caenorhabditis tropicalis TaxID=1561998 RepID=A0A1I7TA35_9PELO
MLQNETGAKQKEQSETIANLREKLTTAETQNAKFRQDIRSRDETIKKKDEIIDKLTKDYNRSKTTCQTLEKRIKQMRNEKEREEKEKEMFAKAAGNRKVNYPVPLNQSLGTATTSAVSSRNPSVPSLKNTRKASTSKGRTVSFADDPNEQSLEVIEEDIQPELMKRYKTVDTQLGPCSIFEDSTGKTTKVTETISNGLLFEYSNGDFRWVNRQNSINFLQIYRYAVDKTIVIHLVLYNISIIYSLQRQLEVHRPGNNITLISVKRREVRTELHSPNNETFYTEMFDRNGSFITKDFCHREVNTEFTLGREYSHRDNGTRRVQCNTAPDDFELIEPEFRLRWFKGEIMVCKVFGRPGCIEKTLRIEINLNTGSGILETVESQSKDGMSHHKQTVFPWS